MGSRSVQNPGWFCPRYLLFGMPQNVLVIAATGIWGAKGFWKTIAGCDWSQLANAGSSRSSDSSGFAQQQTMLQEPSRHPHLWAAELLELKTGVNRIVA